MLKYKEELWKKKPWEEQEEQIQEKCILGSVATREGLIILEGFVEYTSDLKKKSIVSYLDTESIKSKLPECCCGFWSSLLGQVADLDLNAVAAGANYQSVSFSSQEPLLSHVRLKHFPTWTGGRDSQQEERNKLQFTLQFTDERRQFICIKFSFWDLRWWPREETGEVLQVVFRSSRISQASHLKLMRTWKARAEMKRLEKRGSG